MNNRRIRFKNQSGQMLSARLELPIDESVKACAIFAHCFTCGKNLSIVRNIARGLTDEGLAVLRFDFTGLGESEGDFAETNFNSNVDDLLAAASYMETHHQSPSILIGHSLGGSAVLLAASKLPSVQAVATIGAPANPRHVKHLLRSKIEEIESTGVAEVRIGGRSFNIKKQFLDDLEDNNLKQVIRNLERSLLVMHSPQDAIVGIENARTIYEAAMHPKSFISLDGADHLVSNKNDAEYIGDVIASWVRRYVEFPEEDELTPRKRVMARIGRDKYTTQIKAGKHALLADEPSSNGGKGLGPGPYDLLLASLGSCTAMTLRMYADRKDWSLEEVDVHLSYDREHRKDCDECDDPNRHIHKIERAIELKGDLDHGQRKRLLEIADKCPVHKTLTGQIEVVTTFIG